MKTQDRALWDILQRCLALCSPLLVVSGYDTFSCSYCPLRMRSSFHSNSFFAPSAPVFSYHSCPSSSCECSCGTKKIQCKRKSTRKSTGTKQKDHIVESEAREFIELPEHLKAWKLSMCPKHWICRYEGCGPMGTHILLKATDTSRLQPTILMAPIQISMCSFIRSFLLYLPHKCQIELG